MEVIPMGTTQLPLEVILEYLESLKSIYTMEVRHSTLVLDVKRCLFQNSLMIYSFTTATISQTISQCSWLAKEFQTILPRCHKRS